MKPDFGADVTVWCEQAQMRNKEVLRAIAEDALARIKELTPVKTGHLRASWSITLGEEAVDKGNELGGMIGSSIGGSIAQAGAKMLPGGTGKLWQVGAGAVGTKVGTELGGGKTTFTEALGGAAGDLAGAAAGTAIGRVVGAGIGTVFPIITPVVGGLVGGFLGGMVGSSIGESAAGLVVEARVGQLLIISNSAPYAASVEYGRQIAKKDGSSTHVEGRKMLAQTVAELPGIARRAAERVKTSA
jgi:hypothetical protein